MTSQQALEIIKHPFTCCHYGKQHKEASEIIEKELERYEKIKAIEKEQQIDLTKIGKCTKGTRVIVIYADKEYECIIEDIEWGFFRTMYMQKLKCQFKLFFTEYGTYWRLKQDEQDEKEN